MIACEKVGDTGELVQKLIFEAKKRRGPDNSGFRIKLTSYLFRLPLQRVSLKSLHKCNIDLCPKKFRG